MTKKELKRRESAVLAAFKECNPQKAFEYIEKIIKYNSENTVCRFRPPLEREIDLLEKKKIFMVRPRVYEDKGDCEILYNIRDLYRHFMINIKSEKYSDVRNLIDEELDEKVRIGLEKNPRFQELKECVRNRALVACFSENYDEYMWREYANNGEGICLVYDLLDIILNIPHDMKLYPVRYVDDRRACKDIWIGVEEFGEESDSFIGGELKYLLSCFTKEKEPYDREAEWRLLYVEDRMDHENDGKEFCFPIIPSLIILGENITNNAHFEARVRKFAMDNSIELVYAADLR